MTLLGSWCAGPCLVGNSSKAEVAARALAATFSMSRPLKSLKKSIPLRSPGSQIRQSFPSGFIRMTCNADRTEMPG